MTNFGKDMTDKLKKNACKNAYLGSIFIPAKYAFRVCFESPFTRMISNLKYKWPPPGASHTAWKCLPSHTNKKIHRYNNPFMYDNKMVWRSDFPFLISFRTASIFWLIYWSQKCKKSFTESLKILEKKLDNCEFSFTNLWKENLDIDPEIRQKPEICIPRLASLWSINQSFAHPLIWLPNQAHKH